MGICSQIRPLLSAYLDGQNEAQESRMVKEHLESCDKCREELAQLQGLCRLLLNLEKPRPACGLWESIKARLH